MQWSVSHNAFKFPFSVKGKREVGTFTRYRNCIITDAFFCFCFLFFCSGRSDDQTRQQIRRGWAKRRRKSPDPSEAHRLLPDSKTGDTVAAPLWGIWQEPRLTATQRHGWVRRDRNAKVSGKTNITTRERCVLSATGFIYKSLFHALVCSWVRYFLERQARSSLHLGKCFNSAPETVEPPVWRRHTLKSIETFHLLNTNHKKSHQCSTYAVLGNMHVKNSCTVVLSFFF